MDMKKQVLLITFLWVLLLIPAFGDEEKYVVWVDKVNLHESPSTKSNVLTILKMGDEVLIKDEPYREEDGCFWGQAKVVDQNGWIDMKYMLPSEIYRAYQQADNLGRS